MSNIEPLVTVLIPSYNHARFIYDSLTGVINQTYKSIELIVVDDGSTDTSIDIIKTLHQKYNFLFIQQENMGLPKTLNNILKNYARGKYFAICSSDDYWPVDKISLQVNLMESNPQFGMCFGKAIAINTHNQVLDIDLNRNLKGGKIFNDLMLMNFHPPVNYLYLTDILKTLGLFDEHINTEDYYMNLKIAERYQIGYIDKTLCFYRLHEYNNTQIIRQFNSHRLAIDCFKHTPIYYSALKCWHWRSMGVFSKFRKHKKQAISSLTVNWGKFYKFDFLKALFKIIFIWKKI